jgi:hypothetical protein
MVRSPDAAGTLQLSTCGLTACALATLPPSGVIATRPEMSWRSAWITAGPLALSSTSFSVAFGHFSVIFLMAATVSGNLSDRAPGPAGSGRRPWRQDWSSWSNASGRSTAWTRRMLPSGSRMITGGTSMVLYFQ